jgi:ATP-dependent Lon protease
MTTAMVSAFTQNPVRSGIGMTGEISLSGRVFPIGGLRDKLIAAARIGLTECIIPKDNEDDLWDLPEEVRSKLKIHLVESIDEVLSIALTNPLKKVKRIVEKEKKDKESE